MASTADQLSALGADPSFRLRIQSLLVVQAAVVYAEDPATPGHALRSTYAKQVMGNPSLYAGNAAIVIANRSNVVAANTTYDFTTGHVKTDATDAAIASQISTDWSMLSGV